MLAHKSKYQKQNYYHDSATKCKMSYMLKSNANLNSKKRKVKTYKTKIESLGKNNADNLQKLWENEEL